MAKTPEIQIPTISEDHLLAEASEFLVEKLKRVKREDKKAKVRKEYKTIENLAIADLFISAAIDFKEDTKQYSDAREILVTYLERLSSMAQEYPIVKTALANYTRRLGELAKQDQRLQRLYESYERVLGERK